MIWLHRVKLWWTSVQQRRSLRGSSSYIPSSISTFATFAWRRNCKTLARSVTSFMGRSVLSFVSVLFARGRQCYTARLHARFCHAILVYLVIAKHMHLIHYSLSVSGHFDGAYSLSAVSVESCVSALTALHGDC